MAESEKSSSGDFDSSGSDKESVKNVCFICAEEGDPITNKLKHLTPTILSKCVLAIAEREKRPGDSRKSIDTSYNFV